MAITLKLALREEGPSKEYSEVFRSHHESLRSSSHWRVVGLTVFGGRLDFLIFLPSYEFYQTDSTLFDYSGSAFDENWILWNGADARRLEAELVMTHKFFLREPRLLPAAIDMDPDVLKDLAKSLRS